MTKTTRTGRQASGAAPAAQRSASPLRSPVLQAASRACRDFEDGPAARDDMKREVLATQPELLADLLQALSRERIHRADFLSTATPSKESNP